MTRKLTTRTARRRRRLRRFEARVDRHRHGAPPTTWQPPRPQPQPRHDRWTGPRVVVGVVVAAWLLLLANLVRAAVAGWSP